MKWQPIETAPKDGTAVMLHGGGGCFGWTPPKGMPPVSFCFWHEDAEVWVEATGEQCECHADPTHWMPLPPPPEADA